MLRSDGKRDRVTHGFMKPVVRAVLEKRRLRAVRPLIKVMPQFVMDDAEILFGDLDAHLDAHVVLRIDGPGRRVAHHVAIGRLREKGSLPERLWQWRKAERSKKRLAVAHHPPRIRLSLLQNLRQVVTLRGLWRIHQRINVVPLLAPNISQQVRWNRPVSGQDLISIFLSQLSAYISMERFIQRSQLFPKSVRFFRKVIRRHIVVRTPQRTRVRESQLTRSLVSQFDHARVTLPHWRAYGMPPNPRTL